MKLKDCLGGYYKPKIDGYYLQNWTDYDMPFHEHERLEIMYAVSGSFNIVFPQKVGNELLLGETKEINQGELILIDGEVWHRLEVVKPVQIINVEIIFEKNKNNSETIQNIAENSEIFRKFIGGLREYAVVVDDQQIYKILKFIFTELNNPVFQEDSFFVNSIMANLLLLQTARFAVAAERKIQYNPHVKKVIKMINSNIHKKITMKNISTYVNKHYAYLERLFKQS